MSNALLLTIFGVLSYLLGTMNWAVFISKLKKKDIRNLGSGNPGTLNMSRNFGLGIGVLTLVLDIVKGALPTFIGFIIYKDMFFEGTTLPINEVAKVGCGFFAVLGHIFPAFMKFKGGKGIATTIGVFAVCNPLVAAISGALAILFILITEIGAMGSFIATTPGAFMACLSVYKNYFESQTPTPLNYALIALTNFFIVAIIFLTWYAHRKNIQRMLAGEEHPTNWLQMIRESKIKRRNKKNKT